MFITEDGTVTHLERVDAGEFGNATWTSEGGDVHLMRVREKDAQAAQIARQIEEGKLTKEAAYRQPAPSAKAAEPAGNVKFRPAD